MAAVAELGSLGGMTRLLLIAVAALSVSCKSHKFHTHGQPSERVRFAANGGGGLCGLSSPKGGWPASVAVLWGYPLTPEGHIAADSQRVNLIYVVSGHPNANCARSTGSNEEFIASWSATWEAPGESFTMSLTWDSRTEIVTAAGQQFSRTNGNVFVYSVQPSGAVTCRQVPSLGEAANCAEVLRHVQQHCADNRFLSSLVVDKQDGQ